MDKFIFFILITVCLLGCTAIVETYTELPGDGPSTDQTGAPSANAADGGDSEGDAGQ